MTIRWFRALSWIVLAMFWGSVAVAAPPRIQGTPTTLTSNSDRIISYRHQEHLWQTADGALHLIVNRGSLTPGPGLSLWSSFDGGASWSFQAAFANTNEDSVSDGQLSGSDLLVVFQTVDFNLIFQRLRYDAVTRAWSLLASETAWASTVTAAVNPAIAVDANGTVWCGFDGRDRSTNNVNIRLVARPATGGWTDSGLVFGPTDRRSIERSARPVAIPGGMGMVFTVRESIFFASRTDDMALGAAWPVSTIFVGVPQNRTTDPYASHFSVVSDDAGAVHVMLIEAYDVLYFRRDPVTTVWAGGGRLDDDKNTAYSQGAYVNGRVVAAWSSQRGPGTMVTSADGGATWQPVASLALPAAAPGVSYGQARVEMPTRASGPAVLLQQYSDNGLQRLMLFSVPLP